MTKPAVTILMPSSSFGAVIRKYRDKAELNQGELANLIDVNKNTVYNWENNKCKPDANAISALCSVLHIPIQELFGIHDTPESLSNDEEVVLSNYRSLSPKTRSLARQTMIAMAEEDARQQEQELREGYYIFGKQNTKAAAGSGSPFVDETEIPHCFVKVNKLSSKADTLVTVSGRSMEPIYHDGDTLYVAFTRDGNEGDDLICDSADGVVVKRKGADGLLHSLNTELPYGKKYEDDQVRVMGKVIGIVQSDDIADSSLSSVLNVLLSDEVKNFEKEHRN